MSATKFNGSFHGPKKKKASKKKATTKKKATPRLGAVGRVPDHLTIAQKQAWQQIVKEAPKGTLTSADRLLVEQGAICMAQLRVKFNYNASKELRAILGLLLMTPKDRAAPKSKGRVNPFATD